MLELKAVRIEIAAETNIIVEQSHFIKTVEGGSLRGVHQPFRRALRVSQRLRQTKAEQKHPNRTMLIWD